MMKLKDLLLEIQGGYRIFVDLDGVLTDFDKQFETLGQGKIDGYEEKHGSFQFWELIKSGGLKWWSEMPFMKNGEKLWEFIIENFVDIKVLSTPAKTIPESRLGKMMWVKTHLGNYPLILWSNKEDYAGEKNILIDDRVDNINKWKENGGIGILHKSVISTIKELKKFLT